MNRSIARVFAFASLLAAGAVALVHAEPNREGLPTGWEWVFAPTPLGEHFDDHPLTIANAEVTVVFTPGPDDTRINATITSPAEPGLTNAHITLYRPFLRTPGGEVLEGRARSTMSSPRNVTRTSMFRIDDERFNRSDHEVGVARLTLDGRIEASLEALDEARAVGAKALPLPVVGRPYEFEMPTIDGGVIRSEDLRGKVVIVDSWATWCMPCMEKMPALKSLAEKHPDDLVVIGVNFDEDLDDAKPELAKGTVPGVQIHAATLAKGRDDLWERATGIESIPRIFVIDRNGILVDDVAPYSMEQRVEEVLARDDD
jgi:thiol-disulfide isomerase/thioredoxin